MSAMRTAAQPGDTVVIADDLYLIRSIDGNVVECYRRATRTSRIVTLTQLRWDAISTVWRLARA